MSKYEYGRIDKLFQNLFKHKIAKEIIDEIMEGADKINAGAKPEKKAEWFQTAMERMDRLIPEKERFAIREDCACCLGGERLKLSKQIAKDYSSLEGRIDAANRTGFVFGRGVKMEDNGTLTVTFFPEGQKQYQCVCLRKASGPISATYCYCCGGHIKHHLQIALGRKLKCSIISSALSSAGKEGCKFSYAIID